MQRRAFISRLAAAALLASALASGWAAAQPYPNRPITLVVPFPPGGATDAIARIVQDSMSQSLGQQIVIENIGGAGGMIAAGRAARAAPDGYTVLLHQVALAAGMTLYPNLGFDAEKDFVTIGLINTAVTTLAARASLPPNTIDELVRWMKAPIFPAISWHSSLIRPTPQATSIPCQGAGRRNSERNASSCARFAAR